MRKMVVLLAVVGAIIALTAGAALAVTKNAGRGNDTVVGTDGPDKLYGGSGEDKVYGYGGGDHVSGGSGNDPALVGGPGRDSISGGPGNDTVYATDGYQDYIDCGDGYDRVQRDYFDSVRGCEVAF
jgi:Ca2+-binding RTX toxin-like protein